MFLNFISQVNLIIINTLPIAKGLFTRFMDNSGRPGTKSLIDYGLINTEHAHTVTSFVIDEEARYDCGADHALLIVILEFGSNPKTKWSFHEALRLHFDEDSDFSGYQTQLDLLSNNIPLHHFETLPSEQMLPHLTNCIKESGKKNFKLKVKKTKRGIKLPKQILDKIKYKNELARSTSHAHQQNLPSANHLQDKLDAAKADIKSTLSDLNLKRRHRLRSKTLLADPSRKNSGDSLRIISNMLETSPVRTTKLGTWFSGKKKLKMLFLTISRKYFLAKGFQSIQAQNIQIKCHSQFLILRNFWVKPSLNTLKTCLRSKFALPTRT